MSAAHALRHAEARRDAAHDRQQAARDRTAGALGRAQAESDRSTSSADRRSGAVERGEAGSDRESAHGDRGSGADGRLRAAGDRETASVDRGQASVDLAHASLDGLTGVSTRSAGLLQLQREVDRAHRTGTSLVLVFVDVDGLKAVNDSGGHAAGDRLLVRVTTALTGELRPYDLVVRYGGDEFLCVLAEMALDAVDGRMDAVADALEQGDPPAWVSTGRSLLRADDTVERLVERADVDLYRRRGKGGPDQAAE